MSETKQFKVLVTHLNVPRAGIAVLEEKYVLGAVASLVYRQTEITEY